jgi:hypothetical protein
MTGGEQNYSIPSGKMKLSSMSCPLEERQKKLLCRSNACLAIDGEVSEGGPEYAS